MDYFYSASVMGYGDGRFWHRFYDFPNFKRVTKTTTLTKKIGAPFMLMRTGKSVWNRVGLHNPGLMSWIDKYSNRELDNTILSIAGTDDELERIIHILNQYGVLEKLAGIELNFSCPNVKDKNNKKIPSISVPVYLKLNCIQDPFDYDLDKVEGIRLNSVKKNFGAWSGKAAQKYNWPKIKIYNHYGINTAGCSITCTDDIKRLEDYGCKEIGLGAIIMTNPKLVESLDKCPLCKKGKLEMIGVDDRRNYKWYCPKCYKITLIYVETMSNVIK